MIDRVEKEVDMMQRHLEVLSLVRDHEPIGIVRLAQQTGHPNHKVRYSLRVLEEEGVIEPTERGAVTTNRADGFIADFNERVGGVIQLLETMQADEPPAEQ